MRTEEPAKPLISRTAIWSLFISTVCALPFLSAAVLDWLPHLLPDLGLCLAICLFFGPLFAVGLAISALVGVRQSKCPVLQASVAGLGTAFGLFQLLIVFPQSLVPHRPLGVKCLSNLKHQGAALMLYADQNNGRLPIAGHWCDSILPYCFRPSSSDLGELLTCPALPRGERGGYAFDAALGGNHLPESQARKIPMIFESDPGWNLHGGAEIISKHPRHHDRLTLLFVDGHVRWMKKSETNKLLWKPSR